MADQLFPVVENLPEFVIGDDDLDTDYHPSVAWDPDKMDFVLNGKGQMEVCDGVEAYKIWCAKMAYTERYTCLAYPSAIGVELEDAMAEPTEDAVESAVERTITEALMANPRTEAVMNFEFEWNSDVLHVKFTVRARNKNNIIEFPVEI